MSIEIRERMDKLFPYGWEEIDIPTIWRNEKDWDTDPEEDESDDDRMLEYWDKLNNQ